jgi:hypothetical protein
MLRISWPLAILLAALVALLARRPRLFPWILAALAVWFLVETFRRRRGRGR